MRYRGYPIEQLAEHATFPKVCYLVVYAPGAAVTQMTEAIVRDKKRLLPCAAYCDKEYGVGGRFLGVPVILGRAGVEKVIEIELDDTERAAFEKSVASVKQLINSVKMSWALRHGSQSFSVSRFPRYSR